MPFHNWKSAQAAQLLLDQMGQPGLAGRRSHTRVVMVAGRYDVSYNFNMTGAAEVDIIHTQHFDQDDLEQVTRLVERGTIQLGPVIREVVKLDDALRIFDTLRDNPRKLLGTVFVFDVDQGSEGDTLSWKSGVFGGGTVNVFKTGTENIHTFEKVNRFRLQIEHFSDCILHGTQLRFPPEDGLANTRVLVALKEAAETGCAVTIG